MTIDILMATYNGEKYLREQLESFTHQTSTDWRLLVRDDGSNDNTLEILKEYQRELPEGKVVILDRVEPKDHPPPLNKYETARRVIANFSALMERSKADGLADYIMFSDQDDVWHDDKIAKTLAKMKQMEAEHGKDVPLLVHTDARLVNRDGSHKCESVKALHHQQPEKNDFHRGVLFGGGAQGCTMMMNSRLMEMSMPISNHAVMHDAWVSLVAMATGHSGYLAEPTLDYRQHGANVSMRLDRPSYVSHIRSRLSEGVDPMFIQAMALRDHLGDRATPQAREDMERLLSIGAKPNRVLRGARLFSENFKPGRLRSNLLLFGGQGIQQEAEPSPDRVFEGSTSPSR